MERMALRIWHGALDELYDGGSTTSLDPRASLELRCKAFYCSWKNTGCLV